MSAHEEFDAPIDELTAKYDRAELLIAGILGGVAAGATQRQLDEAAAQVAEVLRQLLEVTARWIEVHVPEMYRRGIEEAATSMVLQAPQDIARRMVRSDAHRQSLEVLAQNLLDDMARATDYVGRDAKRTLREIGRRQLLKVMARTNPMARVKDFVVNLEEHGIGFRDRSGRKWKMSRYAEMVLRTQSAVILNAGTLNAAIELGTPGVAVSDGGPGDVDEPCERASGQRWSIPYAIAHPIEHPNCRRAFAPLPRSWHGRLDRVVPGEAKEVREAA
jgi:hypothetical protein